VILLFPIGSAKIKTFYSLAKKKINFKKKNPLARSATKAPKKKKLSFAREKERLKKASFFPSKNPFLNKGFERKAGKGCRKKSRK